MLVVSNTSPICNLAVIARLEFLARRYGVVQIPPAVAKELGALRHPSAAQSIQSAISDDWLRVAIPPSVPALPIPLDAGETEAIALALHLMADVLLLDERRGREAARHFGLVVAGALGELVHAKHAGWISSVGDEIHRLRREAGFFIDVGVERFILSQVGE